MIISILTERQNQAARLVAAGLHIRDIAKHMGVAYKTANAHVFAACERLGMSGMRELAIYMTKLDMGVSEPPMSPPVKETTKRKFVPKHAAYAMRFISRYGRGV